MIVAGQRIAIRVGDNDPLNNTYREAFTTVIDAIREIIAKRDDEEGGAHVDSKHFAKRNTTLAQLRNSFIAHAVERVGSQLP